MHFIESTRRKTDCTMWHVLCIIYVHIQEKHGEDSQTSEPHQMQGTGPSYQPTEPPICDSRCIGAEIDQFHHSPSPQAQPQLHLFSAPFDTPSSSIPNFTDDHHLQPAPIELASPYHPVDNARPAHAPPAPCEQAQPPPQGADHTRSLPPSPPPPNDPFHHDWPHWERADATKMPF